MNLRPLISPVPIQRYFPAETDLIASGKIQVALHKRAAAVTREYFGNKVFVRGVVEVSNFCRQNCVYCGMRRDNRTLGRYRAGHEQIAEMLIHHCPASVRDINIQAGEDPVAVREVVLPLIKTLRRETNLGLSVCLGTLNKGAYDELQRAGASIYILKFETGETEHYRKMESPGTFSERISSIAYLASKGWNVSSGFIAGLPEQGPKEMLANFHLAAELPIEGC